MNDRCKATKINGDRCMLRAKRGKIYCHSHKPNIVKRCVEFNLDGSRCSNGANIGDVCVTHFNIDVHDTRRIKYIK